MRKELLKFRFATVLFWAAGSLLLADCKINGQPTVSPQSEDGLRTFLQDYLGGPSVENQETNFVAAFVDLNGDGTNEAVVYLSGTSWCGSGGCTTLILTQNERSWMVITKITITRLPIRVLSSTSNGWRNIAVRVQGGGIQLSHEAELLFNGSSYPTNPSAPPARRLNAQVPGQVLIPSSKGAKPLFRKGTA
jgi:hypothetical protein